MKLIILSPENDVPNEQEIVKNLFGEGLQYFHLRKPSYDPDRMSAYIEMLPAQYHSRITLHTHHTLAKQYHLGGVHYNSRQPFPTVAEQDTLLRKSCSAHSFLELLKVSSFPLDYVFLSPVFDSISKQGHTGNTEFSVLHAFREDHKNLPPLIALGGITEQNISSAAAMGFNGVAVLGSIWEQVHEETPVTEIVKIFRALRTESEKYEN